jgi:hypothetical protein
MLFHKVQGAGGVGGAAVVGFSFINSSTSTGSTIDYPSGIQTGDLVVFFNWANNLSDGSEAQPLGGVPSGFTNLRNWGGPAIGIGGQIGYRIANSALSGSLTVNKVGTQLTNNALFAFRWSDGALSSISIRTNAATTDNFDQNFLTSESLDCSTQSEPVIAFIAQMARYDETALGLLALDPEEDDIVSPDEDRMRIGYLIQNTPTSTTGVWMLNSSSGGLSIPSVTDSDFGTDDFTYEAWIYPTSLAVFNYIVGHTTAAGGGNLFVKSDGSLEYYEGASRLNSGASAITTNQWYHVAVSRESGTLRMYIDGVEITSTSYTRSITDTNLYVGRNENGFSRFQGLIYKPRVTDSALYTTGFTPTDYTAGADTLMLITADGSGFTDSESNTVTPDAGSQRLVSTAYPSVATPITVTELKDVSATFTNSSRRYGGYFYDPA